MVIETADFNGDGVLDFAVGDQDSNGFFGGLTTWLGRGDGTVRQRQRIEGVGIGDIAVGDFDGDGRPDLAATNFFGGTISVLLGDGGGFAGESFPLQRLTHPFEPELADFDVDGNLDVALVGNNGIQVLYGDGSGGLSAPVAAQIRTSALAIAVGDFDGDGVPDLATGVFAPLPGGGETVPEVAVLLGNGDRTFAAPLRFDAGPYRAHNHM